MSSYSKKGKGTNIMKDKKILSQKRTSGITPKTVNDIVDQSIQKSVQTLHVDDGGYAFGIDLNTRKIVCILVDSEGQIVAKKYLYAEIYMGPEYVINKISEVLLVLMEQNGIKPEMVYGIGFAVPYECGNNMAFPFHFTNWQDVNFKERLEHLTGLEISMIKYGSALALSEFWLDQNNTYNYILALNIFETLVSGGLVVNGNIYYGFEGKSLDIGHMVVDPLGYPCACGKKGCLEIMGNGDAATRYYEDLTGEKIGMGELKRRIQHKDQRALKAIEKCGNYIGMGISNLITILSPDVVYLGGDFILDNINLFKKSVESTEKHNKTKVPIKMSSLKQNSEAYGSAVNVIKSFKSY